MFGGWKQAMSLTSDRSNRRSLRLPAKKSEISSLAIVAVLLADFRFSPACMAAPKLQSLVPTTANTSPDYFCTWNIQGYYASYVKPLHKDAVQESQLFGQGRNQNWLGQYAQVRQDLYFLMDEGWDLPDEDVMVLPGRFPSYATGTQPENFKKLSEAVKKSGCAD